MKTQQGGNPIRANAAGPEAAAPWQRKMIRGRQHPTGRPRRGEGREIPPVARRSLRSSDRVLVPSLDQCSGIGIGTNVDHTGNGCSRRPRWRGRGRRWETADPADLDVDRQLRVASGGTQFALMSIQPWSEHGRHAAGPIGHSVERPGHRDQPRILGGCDGRRRTGVRHRRRLRPELVPRVTARRGEELIDPSGRLGGVREHADRSRDVPERLLSRGGRTQVRPFRSPPERDDPLTEPPPPPS